MATGFSIDSIAQFILNEGGKVEYHKLIKHYKASLADPANQEARVLFKDYVNAVAYVSQEAKTKYLILRPEFLERIVKPCDNFSEKVIEPPPRTRHHYTAATGPQIQSISQPTSPAPQIYQQGPPRPDQPPPLPPSDRHSITGPLSPVLIQQQKQTQQLTSQQLKLQQQQHLIQRQQLQAQQKLQQHQQHHPHLQRQQSMQSINEEPRRPSQSNWFDNNETTPPQPPPRRRSLSSAGSLTPKIISNENKFPPLSEHTDQKENDVKPFQEKLKEIHELAFKSPGRVKEHAQKLNKIVSESDIKPPMPVNNNTPTGPVSKVRSRDSTKEEDNDSASVQPFDPLKRKWMVTASNCDYNELVSLLKEDPTLAGIKDFTSGYTALHWAAKFGKPEIIKLIAGTHGVNVNKKSHGGYTPLHLAAIHNHEHIMELLKIYGADTTIRDHSGKLAEQYLNNRSPLRNNSSAILRSKHSNGSLNGSQHKHHSSSSHSHTKLQDKGRSESSSSAFIRIGSLNNKMRKTAAAITGIKSWGSAESVSDSNTMPPPKQGTSKKKRSKKALSTPPMDKIVASTKDSDSDSAYGFG